VNKLCRALSIKLEDTKNGASLAIFFVNKSFAKLCLLLLLLVVGLWRKQGAEIFNFFQIKQINAKGFEGSPCWFRVLKRENTGQ
jgi:hypothetical protein